MTTTAKKKRPKGFGAFVDTAKPEPKAIASRKLLVPAVPMASDDAPIRGRKKIFDERRQLIARLTPEQYKRVRQLALDVDKTVQELVMDGLSRMFEEKGLEPL